MSEGVNRLRRNIVRWAHDALSTAGDLARTMGRGDPVPSRKTGLGRRLGMEGLEARQLLTAMLLHTLNSPTPEENGFFGGSVAISGNTVVVGAYCDDTGAKDAGIAYVFNAKTGALLHTLNNPTPEVEDNFGRSVAISGNTVVVGQTTPGVLTGRAYVFDATTGVLLHTLRTSSLSPDPEHGTGFGRTVAISGDTIVVGENGPAHVFNAATGALLHTLHDPSAQTIFFGWSVAISGSTVVVGQEAYETELAYGAGRAYVFDATTGVLLHTLDNPTPEEADWFGRSVAVSDNRVVVGASGDDTGAESAGSAYVFDATTRALLHTFNNPTPASKGVLAQVAISGNTVVVGADAGSGRGGRAYVFDATTWALLHTLSNPTLEKDDRFGARVAISGNRVVVGAIWDDTGAEKAGSVYVFSLGNADFNDDGLYDVADIDLLSAAIAFGNHPSSLDLTDDGLVNLDDQNSWLVTAGAVNRPSGMPYPLADANLDGWFDSSDFVQVFQAGKYEDGIENNAVWSSGDWNGDGDFDSADFVAAFQTGLYEVKSRAANNPLAATVDWLFAQNQRPVRRRAYVI